VVTPVPVVSTPAGRRAIEFLHLINANDRAAARAALSQMISPNALREEPLEERVDALSVRFEETRGGEPVRFQKVSENDATLVYRNRLTERLAGLRVRTELTAPFRVIRITDFPIVDQAVQPPRDEAELASRLDRFVSRLTAADAFSGVVLLARGDTIVFHEAYGLADRNLNVPNTVETRFRHASMTKMFTALPSLNSSNGFPLVGRPGQSLSTLPRCPKCALNPDQALLSHTAGLGIS
jgi:hypothetical protein